MLLVRHDSCLVGDQEHLIHSAFLKVTQELLPGGSWKACNNRRVTRSELVTSMYWGLCEFFVTYTIAWTHSNAKFSMLVFSSCLVLEAGELQQGANLSLLSRHWMSIYILPETRDRYKPYLIVDS